MTCWSWRTPDGSPRPGTWDHPRTSAVAECSPDWIFLAVAALFSAERLPRKRFLICVSKQDAPDVFDQDLNLFERLGRCAVTCQSTGQKIPSLCEHSKPAFDALIYIWCLYRSLLLQSFSYLSIYMKSAVAEKFTGPRILTAVAGLLDTCFFIEQVFH